MGTGSHRAQFEGATGRRDRTAGIVHARALKSHSKLKFRQDINQNLSNDKEDTGPKLIEAKNDIEGSTAKKPQETNPSSDSESDSNSESESESESDESSLKRELQMLKSKEKLRAQLKQKKRPVSSWRTESTFSRK